MSNTEPWSAVTRLSENMPRNGSTNGWVTLKMNWTTSLPGLATSSSRTIRRIRRTCRMPNAKVTIRAASVAPPGPAGA